MSQGTSPAPAQLYDLTDSRVYGLALRIVARPQAAEEITEDVYMQAWRTGRGYHSERGKVIAWLLTLCRSRAIDHLRHRDREEPVGHPEDLAPHFEGDDPQNLLSATQQNSRLHAAIEKLSPLERQLRSLAFFRGLTHEGRLPPTASFLWEASIPTCDAPWVN